LAPCKKLVRIEVEVEKVNAMFDTITRDFQKHANLPGFRPGKAPREMVLRRYDKDIEEEAKRKLISESYRQAIDEQKLDVLGSPDIEEIQFGRAQPLQFAATVETAPEFELPEYKGIPVQRETRSVTDEDVEKALGVLAEQHVNYETVDRPSGNGDVVVVNYTGTCEGQPITNLAPTAKGLTEQKNFWVQIGANAFIPGFAEQLQGAKAGDKRAVQVDFPADFVTPQLQGKKGAYDVEVIEVKEKRLPALDDAFAGKYGAENLEKLKEGVRRDLENELKFKQSRSVRGQIVRSLLNRLNFELPESAVAAETRNVVYDIVQENTKRGIPRQAIEEQKDRIYAAATQGAKERVKIAFIYQRIAEKEDIKVAQEEIAGRIAYLAAMYQIPQDKFVKDLQKQRNGLIEIYDQVMNEKVMKFLEENAQVQELPPGALKDAP
jgi:trigger factor